VDLSFIDCRAAVQFSIS